MKKKKKTNKILLIIFSILFILVLILCFVFIKLTLSPVSDDETSSLKIKIEENMVGKNVFNLLEDSGAIRSADIAYYFSRIKKLPMDFKIGTYIISPSWNIDDIVLFLNDGKNAVDLTVRLSFIEGYRAKDYAKLIADNTNLEYDEIMDYWNDKNTIKSYFDDYPFLTDEILNENAKCLIEGYLLADTYELYTETNLDAVTRKFFDNTLSFYNANKEEFNNCEFSIHEIFTLASIVQRESGNVEDMKLVSSVFHNRLQFGMNLQSSVTVCYSLDIGQGSEDWAQCEIKQDNRDPYNTYQVPGLPPGPICNTGKNAIIAAMSPEESEYFYFIGDVCGDGTTYFAETYAEQIQNQERYLTCY